MSDIEIRTPISLDKIIIENKVPKKKLELIMSYIFLQLKKRCDNYDLVG